MSAYYNEFDPFAAQWLRELIKKGLIADGEVDERSITDVQPEDVREFTQCHFFAGIGVWSYALRQAGWADDRPVWTGSCPCQPFSIAGKGKGFKDERHLWPEFYRLISQCRPTTCFGEQVASKDGLAWVELVQDNMEGAGYAFGAVDTCAASIGAPHIRQRLYWVAHVKRKGLERPTGEGIQREEFGFTRCGDTCGLAHAECEQKYKEQQRPSENEARWCADEPRGCGMADTSQNPGPTNGFWGSVDWLLCRDGKWRAVEPGTFPLAHGSPARVGRLRGYGNAINAEQAKAFIKAYLEID